MTSFVYIYKYVLAHCCTCVLPDEGYQRVVETSHQSLFVHWRKSDYLQTLFDNARTMTFSEEPYMFFAMFMCVYIADDFQLDVVVTEAGNLQLTVILRIPIPGQVRLRIKFT